MLAFSRNERSDKLIYCFQPIFVSFRFKVENMRQEDRHESLLFFQDLKLLNHVIEMIIYFKMYKYQQGYMEQTGLSAQLGLLSQSQLEQILSAKPICQCCLALEPQVFGSPTSQEKILIQLRGDFVIQFDPLANLIVCGFRCDYSINFQIVRSPSQNKNTLGKAQAIDFILTEQDHRRVRLLADDSESLENLGQKLEKRYIVHLNFRQNFNAIKILGKGATATVYKAARFRDQKYVAIKSFNRAKYFAAENGKASFLKQFKILSQLDHPHICALEGVYETQNSTYIVMQNLQISLFAWIQKYGFPSYEIGRTMIYQLLKGIEYLHSKGIMHRDLKLENIMLRRDSKDHIQIVIVDLGLAQYVNSEKFLYTRCGTPGYVGPEILKKKIDEKEERYNELCDIFSIGVIFHILFFKKPVFEGQGVKDVIKKNSECQINFSEYNMVDDGIGLLKQMLEKDPNQRISANHALNHQFFKSNNVGSALIQTQPNVPVSVNNIS